MNNFDIGQYGYFEISLHTIKIGVPKMHMNHAYYPIWWIKNVDWYLLPVQIELPSDEEIEQECIDRYIGNLAPTYFTEGAKWAVKWIKDKMK